MPVKVALLTLSSTLVIGWALKCSSQSQTPISPSEETKFSGIIVNDKLSFSSHVDHTISKCNSRLFLMRLDFNAAGLKTFYTFNIRSLLR